MVMRSDAAKDVLAPVIDGLPTNANARILSQQFCGSLEMLDNLKLNPKYATPARYPRGFPDVVGYWAETHIFGGVVVFDRGREEGARRDFLQCHGAYIPPPHPDLLFQLSESQLQRSCRLGSQDEQHEEQITVPFVPEPEAREIDHYHAFRDLNICRDRYERRIDPAPRWGPCVEIYMANAMSSKLSFDYSIHSEKGGKDFWLIGRYKPPYATPSSLSSTSFAENP
ncbi:predicted protein [Uncinocarpus reesii 1704]|uniref:Uncharacterized protein n=1 Tax=Uncinocarpus reesii (strain UAMH 1704) TaxID=336963 RepID=C4JVJ9_UNCRE|nr:uncharacterized protein UREG_06591 [Uncinocarpus reesii 1704]EEP81726.1 predicted protein [Uncinocarpus reesii 1704]